MSNMSSLLYLWLAGFILVSDAVTVPARAAPFGPNIARYAVGPLPGVHYKLPASWAGSIGISGTRDNELFFWLSEAENEAASENLISESNSSSFNDQKLTILFSLAERWTWLLFTSRSDIRERSFGFLWQRDRTSTKSLLMD